MALISGATAAGSAAPLKSLLDDVTELRTQLIALLAKLDLDAGITDVDYESTLTPAALTTTK
ncbi:hypothetical protein LCGC14_2293910 [marine sediment metagenome]|uniref:Uncharacterized protein n=1 Tax=marine sediment metagenome TaxID=412755 RepID=A0A0F9CQE6_9ZZZZ